MTRQVLNQLLGARRTTPSIIEKAALAGALRAAGHYDKAQKLEDDPTVFRLLNPAIVKADQTVGATSDHDALIQTGLGDFLASLGPISAAARLMAAGLSLPIEGLGTVSIPRLANAPEAAAWVGEGAPIPAGSFTFDADTLGPRRKAGVLVVVTSELLKRPAGATVFSQALRERAVATLDSAMFSSEAGDDVVQPGLLSVASPVSSYSEPARDVEALLSELANVGGTGAAAIIANPRQSATLRVRLPQLPFQVWESKYIAEGTIAAIDPTSFASSVGEVDIMASENAVIHMSDEPAEIVSGTGPATADPVRSVWQTNCVALRLLLDITFISRGSRVVKMEGVEWN